MPAELRAGSVAAHWRALDAVDPAALEPLLGEAERARAARFRFPRDRRRYIARWGLVRQLLGQYLNRAPQALRFSTNAYGKPGLSDGAVQFNLSHSQGMALFVFAADRAVGCDIECRDPLFAAQRIAERFFSPAEIASLRALPPALRDEGFFNGWTRKEAYIKALGFGLSLPLDRFDVSLTPGSPPALLRGEAGWSLRAFEPIPGFPAAVVAAGADWELRLHPPEI